MMNDFYLDLISSLYMSLLFILSIMFSISAIIKKPNEKVLFCLGSVAIAGLFGLPWWLAEYKDNNWFYLSYVLHAYVAGCFVMDKRKERKRFTLD